MRLLWGVVSVAGTVACGFPRPADVGADGSTDTTPIDAVAHYLEPRYLPDVCDAVATMPTFSVGTLTFDTGLDSSCTGGVVSQANGPEICVVRYGSIRIGATLTVVGKRALALVADSSLEVDGLLDISAKGTTNGPGGGTVASGDGSSTTSGGGGAGFKTAGGAGGSTTGDGHGAAGGVAATDPSFVPVLVGGTRPASTSGVTVISGAGGGAATLIACRGHVLVSGTINAGGGGGEGGAISFSITVGGAGGGAGGNVVLQGLAITVSGQVFANGGGGGAGASQQLDLTQSGGDGTLSATESAPGGIPRGNGGSGGAGGRQGAAPGIGLGVVVDTQTTAGGGGGSVGFFQTCTPAAVTPILTPRAASPAFGLNSVIMTR